MILACAVNDRHERDDWPAFRWDEGRIAAKLAAVRHRQGRLLGRMEGLGFHLRNEAMLRTLTQDVVKSSEIEGEILDIDQVRSSIARRLGIDIGALTPADRDVEGVVEMMLDATGGYDKPLMADRFFDWHAALFPTGRSGIRKIIVGAWRDDRDGPMQVVSGPVGRERVHYRAPDADRVDAEMAAFLDWFDRKPEIDSVVRAAIAHLWFVTIHPFEDGNGRIARAIADMALTRSEGSARRRPDPVQARLRQARQGSALQAQRHDGRGRSHRCRALPRKRHHPQPRPESRSGRRPRHALRRRPLGRLPASVPSLCMTCGNLA